MATSKGPRTWFITGASRGLGRNLAETVADYGDQVVATARNIDQLKDLARRATDRIEVMSLNVNDQGAVINAVDCTIERFGSLDVLVNNAGYGLAGAVEELSDSEARAQMETNFFGVLNVTRAVLPHMRAQREGHILQISSMAGQVGTPGLALYNASKFALEGLSEALAQEVAPFGIRVTIIEPGPFRTDWAGPSLVTPARRLAAYDATAHKTIATLNGYSGKQPGDPAKAAAAMIKVVESDHPPLRLPLGEIALARIRGKLKVVAEELDTWEQIAMDTSFPPGK